MLVDEPILTNSRKTTSRALQQCIFHLLQKCKTFKSVSQIHTQIVTNGYSQKNYILAKLVSFYAASGRLLCSAHRVFKEIKNPSVCLWNQMIRGHARSKSLQNSIEFFNRMVAREAKPDGFTYSFLLGGFARSGLLREGKQVHGRVLINGYYSNVLVQTNLVNLYAMCDSKDDNMRHARKLVDEMEGRYVVCLNSLLAGYVRCGNVREARKIFDEMPERNVVSWTTMISGYCRKGKCRQALDLFNEMRRDGVEPDQVALVSALSACAEVGNLKLGKWIHSYVEERFLSQSHSLLVSLSNALMHMYACCGSIDSAFQVFVLMPQRSTASWTSMITGFAKQGLAQEALAVFQLMQRQGSRETKPDEITFIGILSACSHAGLIKEGRNFFKNMIPIWGVHPRIEHYGCMVDLLSRAGLLDEACDLIKAMPMKPNDAVWGALLGGCRIHKNVEIAAHVIQNLIAELHPDQAIGYLLLLVHVYASDERWQDVVALKKKIVDMGAKKPAALSWVQANGYCS